MHPRRSRCVGRDAATRAPVLNVRPPPQLVRQCGRKITFVDSLVDSASQIVEAIWPLSAIACRSDASLGSKGVLPLRTFIQETLRRSRTSYSTLQVALYYLILIRSHVPSFDFTMEQPEDTPAIRALQCGRRMFLSALILASKYLQDRNYSARAWSKISGLNTQEINMNEMTFLSAVNWKLHISEPVFQRWTDIVLKYTTTHPPPSPTGSPISSSLFNWKSIIPLLTPELDTVDASPSSSPCSQDQVPKSCYPRPAPTPENDYVFSRSTPTPVYTIPRGLEPAFHPSSDPAGYAAPPSLARLSVLPTPTLTPQSTVHGTPAVSSGMFCSRRSSIGSAFSQIQCASAARSTLDQWPTILPPPQISPTNSQCSQLRRSSLTRSYSSTSSPESMVSDNSSRSSRSSSISSASSYAGAPVCPTSLAIQATCRSAKLCSRNKDLLRPYVLPLPCTVEDVPPYGDHDFTSSPESYTGPVSSVPDFTGFSLEMSREPVMCPSVVDGRCDSGSDGDDMRASLTPRSSSEFSTGQKRSRQSADLTYGLHQEVRESLAAADRGTEWDAVLDAKADAACTATLRRDDTSSLRTAQRLPLTKEMGRKRACCSEEAARMLAVRLRNESRGLAGPGMWTGVL